MVLLLTLFAFTLIFFEAFFALKHPQYSLIPFLILTAFIPPITIIHIGLNLNTFNASVITLCVFISLAAIKNNIKLFISQRRTLILYAILSGLFSLIPTVVYMGIGSYLKSYLLFFLEFIAIGIVLTNLRFNQIELRKIDYFLLVIVSIVFVYGVICYILKFNPYITYLAIVSGDENMDSNDFMLASRGFIEGRVSSTFNHPLKLGQWTVILFPYLYYRLKGRVNIFVYYLILTFLILLCLFCGSRSAIFPMFVAIGLDIVLSSFRRTVKMGAFSLIALFTVFFTLPETEQNTVKGLLFVWDEDAQREAGFGGSSVSGRSSQYEAAFKLVEGDELLGRGEGFTTVNHMKYADRLLGYESFIFKFLIDNGYVGLSLFVVFYFLFAYSFIRKCLYKEEKKRIAVMSVPFFLSGLFTGITYGFFALYTIVLYLSYHDILERRAKYFLTK